MMFQPDKKTTTADQDAATSEILYTPGTYTSTIDLDGTTVDVSLVVDEASILSLSLGEMTDSAQTLYPLFKSSFDQLASQICEYQSLEEVSYDPDTKYTCEILLEAISASLAQASLAQEP